MKSYIIIATLMVSTTVANAGPERWRCGPTEVLMWPNKSSYHNGTKSSIIELSNVDDPIHFKWNSREKRPYLNGKPCFWADIGGSTICPSLWENDQCDKSLP
jgi:hypothetical protein